MGRDFTTDTEPFGLFDAWFREASACEPSDPNAMALATVDPDGLPDVRMVLLKGVDPSGFVFYTNSEARKGANSLQACRLPPISIGNRCAARCACAAPSNK